MKRWKGAALAPLLLALGGCGLGYDMVGAFTTTNIGVNIQATPTPVAEISFARREGALEPTYEDGNLPPVAASIEFKTGTIGPFATASRSVFTGGAAAVAASGEPLKPNHEATVACVTKKPERARAHQEGGAGTMIFLTDSTVGFKVSFPTAAEVPFPNASLGYRRNEMAIAPVFARSGGPCEGPAQLAQRTGYQKQLDDHLRTRADVDTPEKMNRWSQRERELRQAVDDATVWSVFTPSYFAALSNDTSAAPPKAGESAVNFGVRQIFATGKAAENIASESAGFFKKLGKEITATK